MKFLVDTNILIDAMRKKDKAILFLESCAKYYQPCISYISILEIGAGLRKEFEKDAFNFLNTFLKVGISEEVCVKAGRLIFEYARKAKTISFQDALIAATCLKNDFILATANIKHFNFIEDLQIKKYLN